MIEVEIKAKIEDNIVAYERIKEIGGIYSHSEKQHDIYFNGETRDFKKSDEALRIREIPDGEDDIKRILTYKGPKLDTETKTREEIEVTVDNTENLIEILVNIGYRPSAIVNKMRRIFTYEDYTITVDKLNELGYFMEIEYVTNEDDDIDRIQDEIFSIFEKLGITDGFEKASYLELLEENNIN
ncbi:class IV adenylate cyclase [Methanosphaera sp. ISO3-F5]|uniref:class IV adenylate cyclase n=1 Tax=Methanosphaera sp. ISO3-F5 TaxID=1452353 RepID=UPI002B25C810|nr:class IV adenylate cyclase [Methanosphaera sp. ISO3-F5]WQH64612.1 class IV adenylate cyclase [Methanosphaera sp. ISO3-F5]